MGSPGRPDAAQYAQLEQSGQLHLLESSAMDYVSARQRALGVLASSPRCVLGQTDVVAIFPCSLLLAVGLSAQTYSGSKACARCHANELASSHPALMPRPLFARRFTRWRRRSRWTVRSLDSPI